MGSWPSTCWSGPRSTAEAAVAAVRRRSPPCGRCTRRRLATGSRLLVVLDVLEDAYHEVNMGTGGVVADESAADGGTPLTVDWHSDSAIRLPLRAEP